MRPSAIRRAHGAMRSKPAPAARSRGRGGWDTIAGVAAFASLASAVAAATSLDQVTPDPRTALPAVAPSNDRILAITGERLGGFVLPTLPLTADTVFSGNQAWAWQMDDTQRIELRGDVRITLGSFSFSTSAATVWINRLPVATGPGALGATGLASEVNQIAIYFLEASDPTGRAGFGAGGRDLLVTATTRGSIALRVANLTHAPAAPSELSAQGQARLSTYLRSLAQSVDDGTARLRALPNRDFPSPPPDPPPQPGEPAFPPEEVLAAGPETITVPAARSASELPIVRPDGVVTFAAKEVVVDEQADAVTITGSVLVDIESDGPRGPQRLELRAERGVFFLAPGTVTRLRQGRRDMRAGDVLGIYLEGGVIGTDGHYTVRGSKVYYDLANNRATIVDAVLRTYARLGRTVTLYARAAEMRQVAGNAFEAEHAMVSTSEFFIPHLSVGAERVTLTEPPPGLEGPATIVADNITFRAGKVPLFGLPGYEGTIEPQPLKSIQAGYESNQGVEIMTRWDLFQLLGMAPPTGVEGDITVGGYTDRGPALGTNFSLNQGSQSGALDLFGFYDFGGTDRTTSGLDVEQEDDEARGIGTLEYQNQLSTDLLFQAQLAYISDETFVTTFRRDDFVNRRQYESSLYLISQNENKALTLLGAYSFNDFLSNSWLLASRGYQVDKLPELTYRRFGDDIWDGLLWTQTWQANLMSLRPTSGTPGSLGIPAEAFGLTSQTASIEQSFIAGGYRDDYVSRLRMRHELSYPFSDANWTITPFGHGEIDAYINDEFDDYSADADSTRYLIGGGARASTRFVRIDENAASRFFDIRRIRHIIEPNATVWYGYDSLEKGALPVYDQEVEGMSGGAVGQIGVRQQWQTQRGGSGAWQSVNFLTIDGGAVFNDTSSYFQPGDVNNPQRYSQSPLPAFYSWRPELSQWGSHLYGMASWQVSDTLTLAGTGAYLLEDRPYVTDPDSILENLAKGSLGLEMRHSPDVSTYVEYRYIAPTLSELIQFGVLYQVGKKYLIAFSPQYDLREGELRKIQGSLSRTFPDFNLNLTAGYDLIEDQTSFSLSLRIPSESAGVSNSWTGFSSDGMNR